MTRFTGYARAWTIQGRRQHIRGLDGALDVEVPPSVPPARHPQHPPETAENQVLTNSDTSAGWTWPLPSKSPAVVPAAMLLNHVFTKSDTSAGWMRPLWSKSAGQAAATSIRKAPRVAGSVCHTASPPDIEA